MGEESLLTSRHYEAAHIRSKLTELSSLRSMFTGELVGVGNSLDALLAPLADIATEHFAGNLQGEMIAEARLFVTNFEQQIDRSTFVADLTSPEVYSILAKRGLNAAQIQQEVKSSLLEVADTILNLLSPEAGNGQVAEEPEMG